jgi:hypothetical protein
VDFVVFFFFFIFFLFFPPPQSPTLNSPSFPDYLGAAFTLVRSDISGNVQKLEAKMKQYGSDVLEPMAETEIGQGKPVWSDKNSAFTALLWLKRALDYLCMLLRNLSTRPADELSPCVKDAYDATLAKYHGWGTRQIFKIAFAAVPYRKDLESQVGTDAAAIGSFCDVLEPFLKQFHELFVRHNLQDYTP